MNRKTLLVIFFVTLLVAEEVNSLRIGRFFKRIWRSKLVRRLRAKGKQLLNEALAPEPTPEPAAPEPAAPEPAAPEPAPEAAPEPVAAAAPERRRRR
uniref:TSA: Tityus bahiensis Tbah00565 mRNA sequence n=1 Tax=Tityus bahiensis TaxID=50343 RepID=A0A0C9QKW2_TITBA